MMQSKFVSEEMGRSAGLFTVTCVIVIAMGLLVIAYRAYDPVHQFSRWEAWLYHAMLLYLVFVSLRTALLVLFSFAGRLFRRNIRPIENLPLVSIVVPCFNEEKVVEAAVGSLLQMDYPNFEIIVVDDGSTDGTFAAAKRLEADPRVRVVFQMNGGKAVALNHGIEEALGEFILSVDADGMLSTNVIRDGLSYFEHDPQLAAVAGNVRIGNPDTNVITRFQRLEYVIGLNFHKSAQSFLSTVNIVPGPVGLFRKSVLKDVRGYRTGTYAEDADLTLRLLTAGHRIAYCPKMLAVTEAPEDFMSLVKQRYRWSRGMLQAVKANAFYLFRPWRGWRNFCILWYTAVETAVIPSCNFLFAIMTIEHAFLSGHGLILGPFFIQLTMLDVVLATYSVLTEREILSLVFYSLVNRLTYGLSLEVLRFFSIIDEFLGLPMHWNKLARKGL